MDPFHYLNKELYVENVSLLEIARTYDTPCYVYSQTKLKENWQTFDEALATHSHQVCYAVKANANPTLLNILAKNNFY